VQRVGELGEDRLRVEVRGDTAQVVDLDGVETPSGEGVRVVLVVPAAA
jgi:hypothetical protein